MQKSASHMSEDCLFLNVATPVNPAPAKLPVMIWIHGGSYVSGSSTLYHNEVLVAMSNLSVVCVTVNYRLGVFGFLGGKDVSAAASDGGASASDERDALVGTAVADDDRMTIPCSWSRPSLAHPTDHCKIIFYPTRILVTL